MICKRFFANLFCFAFIIPILSAQSVQTMKFDPAVNRGTPFIGLGVQFDPYTHAVDKDQWQLILDRLVYMQPGFFRVMSGATDYCSGFDKDGTPLYRWKTDPNDLHLRRLFDILDFAQQQGIPVYLGEWSAPGTIGIHSPDDPRWPRIIADFLSYLIHERKYTVIHHYIFMNEPNGEWMWRGRSPDFISWSTGIRNLRTELDARGLTALMLTGPDNSGGRDWFRRSLSELHPYFGAWEQHIYAKDDDINSGAMEQRLIEDSKAIANLDPSGDSKERFIAESGLETGKIENLDQQPRVHDFDYGAIMADYVVQVARAGWGGADAWDLDDAMHGNGHGGLKVWGFFDSSTYEGMKPRPWFYAWTVLSRSMPKDAEVLPLQGETANPVRGTAIRWQNGGTISWSVVLVNHTDKAADVSLTIPPHTSILSQYRYFEGERPVNLRGEPRPAEQLKQSASTLQLHFPSRGFVVITTASIAGD